MYIDRLVFEIEGDRLVGDLYRPSGSGPHPAVIVAGPMTSVKEQVTGVYAAALARRGIASLSIDHRGFGESGGAPRQAEDWRKKVVDLRAAVELMATNPDIDPQRLGAVGVCLGCCYTALASVDFPKIRALGLVAGYYRDPKKIRARDPDGFDAKVALGVAARERYEASGIVETIPAAAIDGDAAMQTRDTVDYYTRRAAHPNYSNAFAVMSREHFLPLDVQSVAPRLTQPVTMVHSRNALSPQWAERFYENLAGPKSLFWIDSVGQTDIYDDPAIVDRAAEEVAKGLYVTFARS
jgi:uncharacterized protein